MSILCSCNDALPYKERFTEESLNCVTELIYQPEIGSCGVKNDPGRGMIAGF